MLCLTGNTEGAFHWSQASWRAVVQTMSLCWTVSPNPLFSHHFTTIYHGSQSRTIGNHLLYVLSLSKRVNTGSMAASRFTVIINKNDRKETWHWAVYSPERSLPTVRNSNKLSMFMVVTRWSHWCQKHSQIILVDWQLMSNNCIEMENSVYIK